MISWYSSLTGLRFYHGKIEGPKIWRQSMIKGICMTFFLPLKGQIFIYVYCIYNSHLLPLALLSNLCHSVRNFNDSKDPGNRHWYCREIGDVCKRKWPQPSSTKETLFTILARRNLWFDPLIIFLGQECQLFIFSLGWDGGSLVKCNYKPCLIFMKTNHNLALVEMSYSLMDLGRNTYQKELHKVP